MSTGDRATRALAISAGLHAVVMVLEAVVGWWSGSLALLSDAGHMASDVGTLLLAYMAHRYRTREPRGYTFGLRRLPVIGGLVNAVSLVVVITLIMLEAIDRLDEPPPVMGGAVLGVAIIGLITNIVGAWIIHRSEDQSLNVRGALTHVIADALGSVAAVVSALLILWGGWMIADPIASLVIAVLIGAATVPLFREAGHIILQRAPADVDVDAVIAAIAADADVIEVHDLHLWELDSAQRVLSAVILCPDATLAEASEIADRIRKMLHDRFAVDHATLELRSASAPKPHHHF